jgi:hypothetical protein
VRDSGVKEAGAKHGWLCCGVANWFNTMELLEILAGGIPDSLNFRAGAVVIPGDGAVGQTIGSPEVKILVGWRERISRRDLYINAVYG